MTSGHPPLDALIVLGARLTPEGEPGRVACLRLLHGLKVWRERCPEGYLLLSGGRSRGSPVSEAQAMARFALRWVEEHWGLEFRERLTPLLVLEEASLDTAAAAENVLALALSLNLKGVGLVSDGLHMHRAYFLFRRQFARHRLHLQPFPVPGVLKHYWRRRRYLWLSKMALREAGAWLKVLGRHALGGRRHPR
jgi:uncharacterized SAM-binding protein YcdF (DUF218 family)